MVKCKLLWYLVRVIFIYLNNKQLLVTAPRPVREQLFIYYSGIYTRASYLDYDVAWITVDDGLFNLTAYSWECRSWVASMA